MTAVSEWWPIPVAPREPKSSTLAREVAARVSASRQVMNWAAARMEPTVWDDDGPRPTENMSSTLNAMAYPFEWENSTIASSNQLTTWSANEIRGSSHQVCSATRHNSSGVWATSVT